LDDGLAVLDHYKTLGVPLNASRQEIKRAFRALAKQYHPDRNAARAQWATAQIKRLIEAHRVLSHAGLREAYDRRHALLRERERRKSSVRPKQRPEGEHPRAQAERILYDLLGGDVARALELYERLVRADGSYDLSHHLQLRDWVDCKFLLAEEYQRRSDFERALALYEDLYRSEAARRRFSYFAHELRDRILHVCCRDAAPASQPAAAAQYYLRALALELTSQRKAFLHKKVAECHLVIGDLEGARRHLEIAFRLRPGLKGAQKICRKLSFNGTGLKRGGTENTQKNREKRPGFLNPR
jgi:curved DNA-binding protein CbpA